MAGPYLKDWRKHREMTQEQVVDRLAAMDDPLIPQTTASLSRLENGKQPYTQRSIEALAEVYQCEPVELFEPPPKELPPIQEGSNVANFFDQLTLREQRQALAVIEAIRRQSA